MSDLSQQILDTANALGEGEQTFASFEDALGASMSTEEVAQTEQMLEGAGVAPAENTQAAPPVPAETAAPAPKIDPVIAAPAQPAPPVIAPEVLALFQQQQQAFQQQQAMLNAMAQQNAALVQEFQAARAPAPPPDNTPEEVKQFKQQLWREWETQQTQRDKPLKDELAQLKAERTAEKDTIERQNRVAYFVKQAQTVAESDILSDIDPSLRAALTEPTRDLVLTVAAAMARPPSEVAPIVRQMANQLADARIKTLQLQAKQRVAKNAAAPPQPQLRAVASGDGFDPTKVSDEELHKMGAKDPLDAVFMARRKGLL